MIELRRFSETYGRAFRAHLDDRDEARLKDAYELGREAVVCDLSVLDVVTLHHDALAAALAEPSGRPAEVAAAAGDFLRETLSAFEIVRRGFQEARADALVHRRQAAMLRQLSAFLADASLAAAASDSIDELLRLVAEEARELIPACCAVATCSLSGEAALDRSEEVADALADEWARFAASHAGRSALPARRGRDDGPAGAAWLGAPLTALDGREIGSLEVFDPGREAFGDVDEAVLVHVAQMAAGAVERISLYAEKV